ncbi:MAG: hypothetical protein K2J66_09980, partial [Muribaculaceae bacterium]|nr:hypothetical protein [Muribaculaceae bacterium]
HTATPYTPLNYTTSKKVHPTTRFLAPMRQQPEISAYPGSTATHPTAINSKIVYNKFFCLLGL